MGRCVRRQRARPGRVRDGWPRFSGRSPASRRSCGATAARVDARAPARLKVIRRNRAATRTRRRRSDTDTETARDGIGGRVLSTSFQRSGATTAPRARTSGPPEGQHAKSDSEVPSTRTTVVRRDPHGSRADERYDGGRLASMESVRLLRRVSDRTGPRWALPARVSTTSARPLADQPALHALVRAAARNRHWSRLQRARPARASGDGPARRSPPPLSPAYNIWHPAVWSKGSAHARVPGDAKEFPRVALAILADMRKALAVSASSPFC